MFTTTPAHPSSTPPKGGPLTKPLSPIDKASLTNLSTLDLAGNPITDISPLVDNVGLNEGDEVWLVGTGLDLSEGGEDLENIQRLQERGVLVT